MITRIAQVDPRREPVGALVNEVVICTRNRPDELLRCVRSVMAQSRAASLLIVDSSDGEHPIPALIEDLVAAGRFARVIRTRAGLTHQRNAAIESLLPTTKYVHFVDDDTILDSGYIHALESAFLADPAIVGAGGIIQNLPPHRTHALEMFFGLDSRKEGAVLQSGANILCFGAPACRAVDWLSGCSMSYRRSLLAMIRFDESLPGYGLGEDIDFSMRASRIGRIVAEPRALIWHLQATGGRPNGYARARADARLRGRLARSFPDQVRTSAVLFGVLGGAISDVLRAARHARPGLLASSAGWIMGFIDLLIGTTEPF